MNSFVDLDFIIPSGVEEAEQIKKTFIYADSIATGVEIIDHLTDLMPQSLRDSGIVRPYNAAQSKDYRKEVMRRFKEGQVRVLVCTDAAGMGCNIPDIELVVQWKLPGSVSSFVQRAGRAARAPGITGMAVLLVESSAYQVDLTQAVETEEGNSTKDKGRGKGSKQGAKSKKNPKNAKARKAYAVQRGCKRGAGGGNHDIVFEYEQPKLDPDASDEGLHALVQSNTCRRGILTEIYSNKPAQPTAPCCDLCVPVLLDQTRPGPAPPAIRQTGVKKGEIFKPIQLKLDEWRNNVWQRDYPNAIFGASGILKDDTIDMLASIGPILRQEDLKKVLTGQWHWYTRYGQELYETLSNMDIPPLKPPPKKPRGTKRASEVDAIDQAQALAATPGTVGVASSSTSRQTAMSSTTKRRKTAATSHTQAPTTASFPTHTQGAPYTTQHYTNYSQPYFLHPYSQSNQTISNPYYRDHTYSTPASHVPHPSQPYSYHTYHMPYPPPSSQQVPFDTDYQVEPHNDPQ